MSIQGLFAVSCALVLGALIAIGCRLSNDSGPNKQALAQAKRMTPGSTRIPGAKFDLTWQLYAPKEFDPSKSYPLVLFLHGAGARGDDNISQLGTDLVEWTTRAQKVASSFVLAPQCRKGTQWVEAASSPPYRNYRQDDVPENDTARLVLKAVQEIRQRYPIDARRIYITGPSMGGSATWDFITRYPGKFAAAVPVTGVNDPRRAPVIADLPIWAFHGAKDEASPVANTREMVSALEKLGSPVRYTEYEDIGHNSWGAAYETDELYRWLFEQVLSDSGKSEKSASTPIRNEKVLKPLRD